MKLKNAHASVGGTGRGRRYATQQINFAYAALISAHFQGFCRDLHSECVEYITLAIPTTFQTLVRIELLWNRSLSKGNPHPGAIGSDFNRLGFDFWQEVYAIDGRNERRREMLQELVDWRNAIAHQDFEAVSPGVAPSLQLAKVKSW